MTPDEYGSIILSESGEGLQWEWICPRNPKGLHNRWDRLTFGEEVWNLLPTEITQDTRTDELTVRRRRS
ncbi:MAG TPA: hypothetical protein VG796_28115 [Verrucomicrobiales bacterium]|jgi:hypothetical protein|nr:hypothetical protein [Verrucomicrobiales bacterium]